MSRPPRWALAVVGLVVVGVVVLVVFTVVGHGNGDRGPTIQHKR